MSATDPHKVHLDKVLAFLVDIGLDPVDPHDLKSIHIDPGVITVTRKRRNERGHSYVVGNLPENEGEATEMTTIGIDYTRDSA